MHCWEQVTEPAAAQVETEKMTPKGNGYSYLNDGGDPMREYHVACFDPKSEQGPVTAKCNN